MSVGRGIGGGRTVVGVQLEAHMLHGEEMSTPPILARSLPRLSDRAAASQSSAIRDLLDHAKRPGMLSLAGGLPDASMFPTAELASIATATLAQVDHLQYGATAGEPQARAALCELFQDVAPENVVVTSGSQQGLDLIARVMLDHNDTVVVGDPDYLGALQVFRSCGAALHPVTIDDDGLVTSELETALRAGLRPKCCYLVPHFHNPTGVNLAVERQIHLRQLAEEFGFLIIEDDPYRELYYDDVTPTTLGPMPWLVQLRSTSKTLAPGLRIGAIAGPRWLLDPIVRAKQSMDLHTSRTGQVLVAEAIRSPWYAHHLDDLRSAYGDKRSLLVDLMSTSFGPSVELTTPAGGMFVWARFRGIDTSAWLVRCLDNGVCFVPGAAFAVERDLSEFARFSFSTTATCELAEAVSRMMLAMS